MARADVEIVQGAYEFEAAENTQYAVELAARRLGVEMAADIDRQSIGIGALTAEEHVAHGIDAHDKPGLLAPGLKQAPAFRILVSQRLAVVAATDTRTDPGHLH